MIFRLGFWAQTRILLLFFRGRRRNVQSFKAHVLSYRSHFFLLFLYLHVGLYNIKLNLFRISLLWFIGNQTRFVFVEQKKQKPKNCTYWSHGIIPQGRVVHQFWSEMTCAEEQRRLGCNLTDPFIPLVRPDTGPFNTKAHNNTIEPEVAEKLVKARLGVTNDWKSLHYNWYDWDEDTKVSCAGWSLCLKVSNSAHVSWQSR